MQKNMGIGNKLTQSLFIYTIIASIAILLFSENGNTSESKPVRVGYFHGGRTILLMRAYNNGEFIKKGIKVEFYSKALRDNEYKFATQSIKEFNMSGEGKGGAGKVRGGELIDAILDGEFDLATVGECSFIDAVHSRKPIVAIAELGHDVKNHSGHVFLMRKGLKINNQKDYFGKVLISRRAGAGDSIFLRECLEYIGFDLKKDILQLEKLPQNLEEKGKLPKDKVAIVDQVYEDEITEGIKNRVIDGGYFHLMSFVESDHRTFDLVYPLQQWASPELSHALLVCTREFLQSNADRLVTFLEVYIERIKYEHGLPYEERTKRQEKGLQMAINFYGLNYPQYDIVPTVNINLLKKIINLMRKYKFIDNKNIKIDDFVNNSLVSRALKNLKISEKDDYWQSEY